MSSISLQRVMPGKRNALEVERENFERSQTMAITKAINSQENPAKEKHVRSIILGTHQELGAGTFWNMALKLPLQANPITCWKLCHVIHKIFRDGHPSAIPDSLKYHSHLTELGKLWGHLREGYGRLISSYTKLIVEKMNFHKKNPRIPGNLMMTDEHLNKICESDVNSYFELTVEMLDYLDEILHLQHAVFSSLDMSRSNSMTNSGQCRLAPLIQCIQDSCQLYDYLVKCLFKLHSSLPPDTLSGHRDRFINSYKKLKTFYYNSSNLQYFKHLVQVPVLPESLPNFLIASEFSKHVKPVAVVPSQEPADEPENDVEDTIGMLIDTSSTAPVDDKFDQAFGDTAQQQAFNFNGATSPPPPLPDERDQIIERLMREIDELRRELERVKSEDYAKIHALKERIKALQAELDDVRNNALEKQQENELLILQVEAAKQDSVAAGKMADVEKLAKANDEKFKKLKDIYGSLREEHVKLIRKHADISKRLESEKKSIEERDMELMSSRSQMELLLEERRSVEDQLQKSADDVSFQLSTSTAENTSLITEKESPVSAEQPALRKRNQDLESRLQTLEDTQGALEKSLELSRSDGNTLQEQLRQSSDDKNTIERELLLRLDELHRKILGSCIQEGREIIQDAVDQCENPTHLPVTCTAEFLLLRTEPMLASLPKLQESIRTYRASDKSNLDELVQHITSMSHHLSDCVLHGIATSHSAQIEPGEELANACRQAGEDGLEVLNHIEKDTDESTVTGQVDKLSSSINHVIKLAEALLPKMTDVKVGEIGDIMEDEMHSTTAAIELAASKFEEMLHAARKDKTGIQLEVNERILDSCNALMKAIKMLVEKSRDLQKEISQKGRGTTSSKEFYKKNHRWTEGLISAAKAVGWGANALVDAADKVMNKEGKFEELMVCSQEIAASTAQLVVASKVKADRGSEALFKLSDASKGVSLATGNVVASAKTGAEMIEEQSLMDFSKLTLHQTKKLEMQTQVRVLELESLLEKERMKLGHLRKTHYRLAGESEGWDQQQAS